MCRLLWRIWFTDYNDDNIMNDCRVKSDAVNKKLTAQATVKTQYQVHGSIIIHDIRLQRALVTGVNVSMSAISIGTDGQQYVYWHSRINDNECHLKQQSENN